MRQNTLKQASVAIIASLVGAAVIFVLLRSFLLFPPAPDGGAKEKGAELFKNKGCINCHYPDSQRTKVGPGLKGLFKRDALPVSGRKVTAENVKKQLTTPYKNMPSFANRLTDEQRDELIAYLKTL